MSKILFIIWILIFSININSQTYQPFEDGTRVYINLKTSSPLVESDFSDKLRMWQAGTKNANRLERYITNDNSKLCIGYILEYQVVNNSQFKVSLKAPNFEKSEFPFKSSYQYKELKKYPEDIIVNDGDVIILDLLENAKKDFKAQDLIVITKNPLKNHNYFSNLESPKDFKLNDINLHLEEFTVSINGSPLKQKSLYDVKGHIIAFHFKNKGEIYLSLFPQKGYNFQKIGTVDGSVMTFKINGDLYKIVSSPYIWVGDSDSDEVRWNLWGYYVPEEKLKDKVPDSLDYKGRILNSMPRR